MCLQTFYLTDLTLKNIQLFKCDCEETANSFILKGITIRLYLVYITYNVLIYELSTLSLKSCLNQ